VQHQSAHLSSTAHLYIWHSQHICMVSAWTNANLIILLVAVVPKVYKSNTHSRMGREGKWLSYLPN
jgi:hypothetical protein